MACKILKAVCNMFCLARTCVASGCSCLSHSLCFGGSPLHGDFLLQLLAVCNLVFKLICLQSKNNSDQAGAMRAEQALPDISSKEFVAGEDRSLIEGAADSPAV